MKLSVAAFASCLIFALALAAQPAAAAAPRDGAQGLAAADKPATTKPKDEVKADDKDKPKKSKSNPNDGKDGNPTDGNAGSGNDNKPK